MSGVFDEIITYGPGGYDTTKPNNNIVSTSQSEVPVRNVNERNLFAKAQQALVTNAAYLAQPAIPAGTLTAAQLGVALRIVRAQVDAVTRQNNAIIRLILNSVDDVSGT